MGTIVSASIGMARFVAPPGRRNSRRSIALNLQMLELWRDKLETKWVSTRGYRSPLAEASGGKEWRHKGVVKLQSK